LQDHYHPRESAELGRMDDESELAWCGDSNGVTKFLLYGQVNQRSLCSNRGISDAFVVFSVKLGAR
jgi:hypothetical protein